MAWWRVVMVFDESGQLLGEIIPTKNNQTEKTWELPRAVIKLLPQHVCGCYTI